MLTSFFEALRFLTVIPAPFGAPVSAEAFDRNIARAMAWFPIVGLLIGAIGAAAGWLGEIFWGGVNGSPLPRAVLALVAMGIVTSGLHLDGLSDTFDAVMSWRSRDRKLEIMKDSRIGAMGALALIAVLLLKAAFLATPTWLPALLIAAALGRWVDLYAIFFFPSASEGGLGRSFKDHTRMRDFVLATVLIIAIAAGVGYWQAGTAGVARSAIALSLALAVTHGLCARWTRSLGGLTGDIFGAVSEIGEVVALAALTALTI